MGRAGERETINEGFIIGGGQLPWPLGAGNLPAGLRRRSTRKYRAPPPPSVFQWFSHFFRNAANGGKLLATSPRRGFIPNVNSLFAQSLAHDLCLNRLSPFPIRHHDANVLFEINGLEFARLVMVLDKGFRPLPFAVQCGKSHAKRYPLAQ